MKIIFFVCLSVFIAFWAQAQVNIPTGQWRVHLPYQSTFELTETPNELLAIAQYGSFTLNKKDGSVTRLSKVQGYAEAAMQTAAYNFDLNILLIAYQSGNLDLVKGNQIINIPEILRSSIGGEKKINHIHFYQQYAFLSTTFGLLALDVEKNEIKESYLNIGPGGSSIGINSCTTLGDSIYVATNVGIFSALNSGNVNLNSYLNWGLLGPAKTARHIQSFAGKLYADPDSNFSVYANGWQDIENNGKDTLKSLYVGNGKLVAAKIGKILIFNQTGIEKTFNVSFIDKAIVDAKNQTWFVVRGFGLIKKLDNNNEEYISPNGPNFHLSYAFGNTENAMWGLGGGYNTGYDPLFSNDGYGIFENGNWRNRPPNSLLDSIRDFSHFAYNKPLNQVLIGTQSSGIIQFNGNGDLIGSYTTANSPMRRNQGNNFLICNGLAFDNSNNLWVSNPSNRDSQLLVRNANNEWKAFSTPIGGLGKIVVDKNNYKWIILAINNTAGILVLDDNKTPLNALDDKIVGLSSLEKEGKLINNNVVSLALDRDGEMWIGTTQGICVIRNTKKVFDAPGSFDADRLIITQENNTNYLLGDEKINDIVVDGGNRKWIATNRGVFLVSQNGDSILQKFDKLNSPLLDNVVQSIGIDPSTGEVFFASNSGIVSYRGFATSPKDNLEQIKVFPNPVRSGYKGNINIINIMENSLIKITDINGQLVSEGRSNGGSFTWDGNNLNNERVSSGVYLVLVASTDGLETNVAKILFLK